MNNAIAALLSCTLGMGVIVPMLGDIASRTMDVWRGATRLHPQPAIAEFAIPSPQAHRAGIIWEDNANRTLAMPSPSQANAAKLALGVYAGEGHPAHRQIEDMEKAIDYRFDILHLYTGFNVEFNQFRKQKLEPAQRDGSIPLISWAPGVTHGTLYREIANGQTDAYLKRWAKGLKAWGKPVMIRFAYEMNMANMDWNATPRNGGPAHFVQSWRRIHDIFQQEGVTNAQWVWCPHADHDSPHYTDLMQYYPGDAYVDWVGLDGYHWGAATHQEMGSFDQVFKRAYSKIQSLNKPVIIAEIGSPADSEYQAQWLHLAFQRIRQDYPMIKAFVYFNADFSRRNERDWRISQNAKSLDVLKQVAHQGGQSQ